jgi:hypothetical protein
LAGGVAESDLRRDIDFCSRLPAHILSVPGSGIRLIIFRVDRMVFGLNIGTAEKSR